MPKVSVIIPVYNVEPYLRECLDSVVNQTLEDIEIICVDDGSKDNSLSILKEYAAHDNRVSIFNFTECQSALVARKQGVLAASGEYILFLDADDYLEPNACEELYNKIKEENVEILHFNSQIENCANLPQSRIDMNAKLLRPLEMRLSNEEVFSQCFYEKNYGFTLWNKIFSASLLKIAFSYMVDKYLPKAQDLYSYFIIAYFAKSYLGWDSDIYHHYCFGRGVTGSTNMSLTTFKRYCLQYKVVNELNSFCQSQSCNEEYFAVINRFKEQWLNECIDLWMKKVNAKDVEEASKILLNSWDAIDLVEQIANKHWYSRDVVSKKIAHALDIPLKSKSIKTIALYYYHCTIGGVQRVISLMIPLYLSMGYKVVFITDKDASEQDIVISENIERIVIQDYQKTNKNNYRFRAEQWKQIVEQYAIDVVIYHAWTSNLLLWDMMLLKLLDVAVVVQAHSIFSYSLISMNRDFAILPRVFALCDGLVVLSAVDKVFWGNFNNNVHHIPNPINPTLVNAKRTPGDNKNIIWVGRFSNEKQPWEALNIMEKVVQRCPDAQLLMIGDSTDKNALKTHIKNAEKKGISQNVHFLGYQIDVDSFYEAASVNLITSTYEGFGMTLLEAQAHGLPTVMYDMPYLDLAKESHGVVSVEPGNRDAAAIEICDLLENKTNWLDVSELSKQGFDDYCNYNHADAWKNLLAGYKQKDNEVNLVPLMMYTIINHYSIGWERNNRNNTNIKSDSAIIPNYSAIINDTSKQSWFLSKIRGGIRCYKEHGLIYTLKRTLEHLGIPMGIKLKSDI